MIAEEICQFGDYRLQLDLPVFNGNMHIQEFIDWIAEVEHFFIYMDISETKKVKLVVLRFKGTALARWDQKVANHAKYQKQPVWTWDKLKRSLRQ